MNENQRIDASPVQTFVPAERESKKKYIYVVIGFVLLIIVIFAALFLINSRSSFEGNSKPVPKDDVQIVGSEVIRNTNNERQVLFTNVSNVSAVRLGPDGNTLHFKPIDTTKRDHDYCANLGRIDSPAPSGYQDAPPRTPPWDFEKLGYAYTVGRCDGNGYLSNADYFVYLVKKYPQNAIIYENILTGKKHELPVSENVMKGFSDGESQFTNTFQSVGLIGKDGNMYYYPRQNIKVGDTIVVSFGLFVAAIDTQQNKLLGTLALTDKDLQIVSSAFLLKSHDASPYVVIESAWEGPAVVSGILDVSKNSLTLTKTAHIARYTWLDFSISPYTWAKDSIVFNSADIENIQIPESFLKTRDILTADDKTIAIWSRELEVELAKKSSYQKIVCDLNPGVATPNCAGLKKVTVYTYSSNTGLVKQ